MTARATFAAKAQFNRDFPADDGLIVPRFREGFLRVEAARQAEAVSQDFHLPDAVHAKQADAAQFFALPQQDASGPLFRASGRALR